MSNNTDSIEYEKELLVLEKRLLKCLKNGEDNVDEIMNLLCTRYPNEWKPLSKEELEEYKISHTN
ncbi:hypothetical protein GCL60_09875 [Silvanigrella paludirubra]|uniref:Uncharacterized protein n=1 Tax=Silvanigrella paludirubra TaxID=2499159 RepID=A0A6N6VVB2_9BACT|nr:hypothetical protein [Silvanigrella paludirubra]KAB8039154.1 hypothetical protein GCL60_09875 [Silvanigrella paludirubra]